MLIINHSWPLLSVETFCENRLHFCALAHGRLNARGNKAWAAGGKNRVS